MVTGQGIAVLMSECYNSGGICFGSVLSRLTCFSYPD